MKFYDGFPSELFCTKYLIGEVAERFNAAVLESQMSEAPNRRGVKRSFMTVFRRNYFEKVLYWRGGRAV